MDSELLAQRSDHPFAEEDIHAYVDRQMDEDRRSRFEAHMLHNPEVAQAVIEYRRQNEMLVRLFGPGRTARAGGGSNRGGGKNFSAFT